MADLFDDLDSSSPLLCDESKDLCFDDLDYHGGGSLDDNDFDHHHHHQQPPESNDLGHPFVCENESQPLIILPEQSEDFFASMVEREREYLPKEDYLNKLRCGVLDLSARAEAFDWIFKAHSYYSFGPLSFCLAVNYLDRFLSSRELPSGKAWAVQLLAVACLTIAVKIEETSVPQSVEFQVEDPKYVFVGKTIQRMELLVLDTLKWRMNAITPCSFLEYSLNKLCDAHNHNRYLSSSTNVMNRSMHLVSCIIRGIDFLEFRPSEIAAAAAMSVTAEIQAVDINKACSCFIHLDKDRIKKCVEMIKDNSGIKRSGGSVVVGVPQSPIGVLEAGCFSFKSDELTTTTTTTTTTLVVGSCANSSQMTTNTITTNTTSTSTRSPENKRIKLDTTTTTITTSSSSSRLDS